MKTVKHATLRSQRLHTKFGPHDVDANGHFVVEDKQAEEICSLYGKDYQIVGEEPKAEPKAEKKDEPKKEPEPKKADAELKAAKSKVGPKIKKLGK